MCVVEPEGVEHFWPGSVPLSLSDELEANGSATYPVFTALDALSALAAVVAFFGVLAIGAVSALRRRPSSH